ncbi:PilN domain-containing protein [Candidatus Kaiserbacteria bacterium]|nr:PilN domain-containing protein [Candidatus Kaiserbacteria bacterium]
MSNVIPQETRKIIGTMYRSRFMMAFGLVGIACAALSALALLPSYLALHASGTAVQQPTSARSESDREVVARMQVLLAALKPLVSTTTTPTGAVLSALAERPSGVHVTHITYTPGVITVTGESAIPSAVDTYRRSLTGLPLFESASVPVNDLIGAQGGSFSMTLSGEF